MLSTVTNTLFCSLSHRGEETLLGTPTAYLLNLIFARPAAAGSATGLFNNYNVLAPVGAQSKAWYAVPAGWPSPGSIQPNQFVSQIAPLASWETAVRALPDKERHDDPVYFICGFGIDLYIRVVPDSSWSPVPNNLNGLIAAFARSDANHHDGDSVASPFVLGGAVGQGQNTPCSYFAVVTPPAGTIAPLSDNSWIIYLGKSAQNAPGGGASKCPDGKCIYSLIVAAGFWQGTNLYTYSHDPNLIVWVPTSSSTPR